MEDFASFSARIKPHLAKVESIARKQLHLFQAIGEHEDFALSEHALTDYARFVQFASESVVTTAPSMEVQLLWMVHSLNPRHYFADFQRAFGKQMAVPWPHDLDAALKAQSVSHQLNLIDPSALKLSPSLDLTAAVQRQLTFVEKMNRIQRSQTISSSQLKVAKQRYIKFLYLMSVHGATLPTTVPTWTSIC